MNNTHLQTRSLLHSTRALALHDLKRATLLSPRKTASETTASASPSTTPECCPRTHNNTPRNDQPADVRCPSPGPPKNVENCWQLHIALDRDQDGFSPSSTYLPHIHPWRPLEREARPPSTRKPAENKTQTQTLNKNNLANKPTQHQLSKPSLNNNKPTNPDKTDRHRFERKPLCPPTNNPDTTPNLSNTPLPPPPKAGHQIPVHRHKNKTHTAPNLTSDEEQGWATQPPASLPSPVKHTSESTSATASWSYIKHILLLTSFGTRAARPPRALKPDENTSQKQTISSSNLGNKPKPAHSSQPHTNKKQKTTHPERLDDHQPEGQPLHPPTNNPVSTPNLMNTHQPPSLRAGHPTHDHVHHIKKHNAPNLTSDRGPGRAAQLPTYPTKRLRHTSESASAISQRERLSLFSILRSNWTTSSTRGARPPSRFLQPAHNNENKHNARTHPSLHRSTSTSQPRPYFNHPSFSNSYQLLPRPNYKQHNPTPPAMPTTSLSTLYRQTPLPASHPSQIQHCPLINIPPPGNNRDRGLDRHTERKTAILNNTSALPDPTACSPNRNLSHIYSEIPSIRPPSSTCAAILIDPAQTTICLVHLRRTTGALANLPAQLLYEYR